MIGLNKIWLNQVQLNRLYLNAPFPVYRKMTGGGSSGDGFPVLPGDVTRWHFGGLTNEMMAAMDDPRLEDADGKGRFLSFKNFAWGGMSGVGGYETNAEIYEFSPTSTNKIVADRVKHISYTFEVKGMVSGNDLSLRDGINTIYYSWKKDGIYTVDVDVLDPAGTLRLYNGYSHQKGTFTVRIFPSYPGALVFDGVDDCGVCDNFPILTKEKGYTVVALRSYLAESIGYLVYNGTSAKQSAFAFERSDSLDTWSWGINSSIRNSLPKLMSYQTSNSYNNNIISTGTAIEGDKLIRIASSGGYCNVAIWELVFLDHDATEEELTKIKDYFVKTYPWLFPDQAWTVVGKTNEDEDRATIANITGNGNDLVLYNLGFAEGSGYNEEGEYAGYLVTDGVDDRVVSRSFTLNKDWTIVGNWKMLQPEANKSSGIVKQNSLFIYNHVDGLNISINDAWNFFKLKDICSVNAICSDGRIYLNDWTEIIDSKQQTVNESVGTLVIGILGNVYTSLAFKNLGIYNNQILSKDDCIKAYNYLQTLKAK